jgi:hypothetical protein
MHLSNSLRHALAARNTIFVAAGAMVSSRRAMRDGPEHVACWARVIMVVSASVALGVRRMVRAGRY